jgi:hypothetical protein
VCGGVDVQGGVEGEDYLGAAGEFLLAIVLEPPDSGYSGTYAETDDRTYAAADDGTRDDSGSGGEADRCCCGSGMNVADDGAFVVDVRVIEVVEVRDFGSEFVDGAVGEADAVWLETDGGRAGDAAAAVNLCDAAVDEASGGEQN